MRNPFRPALRWHGGKWRLGPHIVGMLPAHRTYTETFGGAASVLMRKPRSRTEVYNDLDDDVVNLFRVLRDPARARRLVSALRFTPFSRIEFKAAYEPTDDLVERARRLVVRSFQGFGSNAHNVRVKTGFRARSNNPRQHTDAAGDWSRHPDALEAVVGRLRGVIIEHREALDVLRDFDVRDALHYVDPPYVHATRGRTMTHNYNHELNDRGHANLASALRDLKGSVVVSGYECPLYSRLYRGWKDVRLHARADGGRDRVEVLWFNPRAWSLRP